MIRPLFRYTGMIATGLALSLMATAPADARRGGSFGSRGMRTYSAPRETSVSPGYVSPVQRSMTSPSAAPSSAPSYAPAYGQPTRSFGSRFGGFGGGLVGGLLAGGLIGAMMGHGMGGGWGGGGLLALIQIAIIGGILWFLFGLFRRKPTYRSDPGYEDRSTFSGGTSGYASTANRASVPVSGGMEDIAITAEDQNAFERLLIDVQDAFGHEDYGRLRERCTPEVMSYLSEELSQNATHGRRNDVSGTRLIDADVSEAWREGATDYATIAMRYESIDVMRDRTTGAIVDGDATRPTETVELWTFTRSGGSAWKLSAIQEA
jgi:predicted lipid-binding transport protein (Tim44 family)